MSDPFPRVQGQCPMGCGDTLFVGSGGYVTCSFSECPNPTAICDIMLEHAAPHHIVQLTDDNWTIQHPIRERLNGFLFDCPLTRELSEATSIPRRAGRYRVHGDGPFAWTVAP